MECKQYLDYISRYLDNELSIVEEKELQQHLLECSSCLEEWTVAVTMKSMLSDLEEKELPEHFHQSLMNKLQEDTTVQVEKVERRWINKHFKQLTAVAGLVLVVGSSLLVTNQLGNKSADSGYEEIGQSPTADEAYAFSAPIEKATDEYSGDGENRNSVATQRSEVAQPYTESVAVAEHMLMDFEPIEIVVASPVDTYEQIIETLPFLAQYSVVEQENITIKFFTQEDLVAFFETLAIVEPTVTVTAVPTLDETDSLEIILKK